MHIRRAAHRRQVLAAALVLVGAAAHAEEQWFVFSIAETPVGHSRESVTREGDRLRTDTTLDATLNRLGTEVEMRFEYSSLETANGELASLRSDVRLSQQTVRVEATVEGERIRILASSGAGAAPHERWIERGPAPLLGPQAVRRRSVDSLRRAGDTLEYATFSPELQRVVAVRRTVLASGESAPCAPRGTTTTRIAETVEGVAAARTLWVEADGELVQDAVSGPFGEMVSCRASREQALLAEGGSLPEEMYRRTLVIANLRLRDPFAVDRLLLRVRARQPEPALPDLAGEHQQVRRDGDALLVAVTRPAAPPAATTAAPAASAGPPAEYLQPNALIESDHPALVALAREVAGEARDPWQTAQRLTAWVAANLTLDLGVVLAPASELARERRGTCVGYATLLATLARATGIPSRVAMGMVYYGGIWGGHAWTEVWIDGRWLPLDAAVYAPGVASAVRLAAGTSSLLDGGGELTNRLAALFGNVDLEIVQADTASSTVTAAAGAPAYTTAAGSYHNPGLGLEVEAPGWTVEEASSVWPSTLVVAFRRGEERVELHELPAHPAHRLQDLLGERYKEGSDLLVVSSGGTVWLFTAGGPRPTASLRELLAAVKKGL